MARPLVAEGRSAADDRRPPSSGRDLAFTDPPLPVPATCFVDRPSTSNVKLWSKVSASASRARRRLEGFACWRNIEMTPYAVPAR
jgi:hypothetical protein